MVLASLVTSASFADTAAFVSVPATGAKGDGLTDDTRAIQAAIDQSPAGAIVDFGDANKIYLISGTLRLRGNRTYQGHATLQMSPNVSAGTPMAQSLYLDSDNVTIQDLTFDAKSVGGILQLDVTGSADVPMTHLTIQRCTFRNTQAVGAPWMGAVYSPVGVQGGTVSNNRFQKCSHGIFLANPNKFSVTHNSFDTITSGDAIFMPIYARPFETGNAIEISDNAGVRLSRMGIELFGAGGNTMDRPLVARNVFTNWSSPAQNDPFGISVVVGTGAQILDNVINDGVAGYGIEVGVPAAVVSGNTINGFPYGIAVQGQTDVTISNNTMISQTDTAILLANAGNNRRTQILNNRIVNPKRFGIGQNSNDSSGSVIQGNTIERAGGVFPDDDHLGFPFVGIKVDSGLQGPITVSNNTLIQTATAPPAGFWYWGIAMFGGYPGSQYSGNYIETKSSSDTSVAFALWYNGYLDGSTVQNSQYVGLSAVSTNNTSSRIANVNNSSCRVRHTDSNLVSHDSCLFASPAATRMF